MYDILKNCADFLIFSLFLFLFQYLIFPCLQILLCNLLIRNFTESNPTGLSNIIWFKYYVDRYVYF